MVCTGILLLTERMSEMTREYTLLFNGITRAIEELDRLRAELARLQCEAEEMYIQRGDNIMKDEEV